MARSAACAREMLQVFKSRLLDKAIGNLTMLSQIEWFARRVVEKGQEFSLPDVHGFSVTCEFKFVAAADVGGRAATVHCG